MKHKNLIIITLLLITIVVGLFYALRKENRELLKGCQNTDKSYDNECISMSKESRWANADNGMPKGWVIWQDTIDGVSVVSKGPIMNGASKVITTSDLDLIKKLRSTDPSVKCVGDLEITTCAMGNHPEILRYWNVINYFY